MKKKLLGTLLAALCLVALWGCESPPAPSEEPDFTVSVETEEPTVPATVAPDGNPNDVTCKGSYTGTGNEDAIVAVCDGVKLTNRQLSAWYWAEVAQYRQERHDTAPDFDRPLDTQVCPVDDSVATWQQYFLKKALTDWHTAQALASVGLEDGVPTDESYRPIEANHKKYMTGMPATKVLHGYNKPYAPNTLHQAYLDSIPGMLEDLASRLGYQDAEELCRKAFGTTVEETEKFVRLYNYGYMYYTQLGYEKTVAEETVSAYLAMQGITAEEDSEYTVDLRHILILPESCTVNPDGTLRAAEADWEAAVMKAEDLLDYWMRKTRETEATFAELAHKNSQDTGSALNGGSYRALEQGQLIPQLDSWCFAPERQAGDTAIVRSEYGVHMLYFARKTGKLHAQAEQELQILEKEKIFTEAKLRFAMETVYDVITLPEAEAAVSLSDVLYPDIAHQRYPEVPLYLQQDYPGTMFGGYELRTHGCGITTMSMLASYMTDDEWTPPEMCARYSNYSYANGTDGMIFIHEPPVMGFYLIKKTYEPPEAKAALENGYIVLSIQHQGYWTRGGHYILLEDINEAGLIQVRDSNIFNYGKLENHKVDRHTWGSITSAGSGFWIFDYKITRIPACSRCGDPENNNAPLAADYICEKCSPAILRRDIWLRGDN